MSNDFIRTTEERDTILNSIDILLNNLYMVNSRLEKDINASDYLYIKKETSGEITNSSLSSLKEKLINLPVIGLTVSFVPNDKLIQKLSDWVKKNVNKEIIINLICDPEILGGLQISYKGQYMDESFSRKLGKVWNPTNII